MRKNDGVRLRHMLDAAREANLSSLQVVYVS
jgi:hypothetical protein